MNNKKIIYIVEDSKIISGILKKVISSIPDVETKEFTCGEVMFNNIGVDEQDMVFLDYYLYEKKYWLHGWASIMPVSKGLTDYSFTYEDGDIDFDIGIVAGWKFNRNLGVFGEGRYLSAFGIDAYEVKVNIDIF